MADRDNTRDLPQDAPLRVRLWWRFWRGWGRLCDGSRRAMALSFLSAVLAMAAGFACLLAFCVLVGPFWSFDDRGASFTQCAGYAFNTGWLAGFARLMWLALKAPTVNADKGDSRV